MSHVCEKCSYAFTQRVLYLDGVLLELQFTCRFLEGLHRYGAAGRVSVGHRVGEVQVDLLAEAVVEGGAVGAEGARVRQGVQVVLAFMYKLSLSDVRGRLSMSEA